jgi:hypothetical protein
MLIGKSLGSKMLSREGPFFGHFFAVSGDKTRAGLYLAIAKETKCIDDAACDRLDQMRQDLEQERRGGLTDKNTTFLGRFSPRVCGTGSSICLKR